MLSDSFKFYWVKDDEFAGSSVPEIKDYSKNAKRYELERVVCLLPYPVKELEVVSHSWEKNDVEFINLGMTGGSIPSQEMIDQWLDILKHRKRTMVHCSEGNGRTGTMLGIALVEVLNITGQDAFERIRSINPSAFDSEQQVSFMKAYK